MQDPATQEVPQKKDAAMIMLVDDQTIIAEAVRRILATCPDLEFHYCSEGAGAVETAASLAPMVILQDLVMPDADGLDLLRRYRANPDTAETPVIVLSTKEEPAVKKAAFEAGASDYLVKLPDPIEFIARVRHHAHACMAARRLADALRALRESREQLLERNMELEKLNEQKNRLLGMAAHDLRNPLGVIMAYSEFLRDETGGILGDGHREMVSTINETSEFMLNMVEDLLDVTTIESGRLQLETAPVDLAALVHRNVELNRVFATKKNITLDLAPPPAIPPLVIDAGKITQVLNNLVGNAVKYSHADTTVRISIERRPGEVVVSVTDQGQGIPPGDLDKLFKPFGRANVQSTAGEQSTGLGLAIARKIVEGHGGRIWVESTPGLGSTFHFSVPCPQ